MCIANPFKFGISKPLENVISSFYLEEDTTQEKLVEDAYLNAELYNQQLFLNQERENYDTVLNFTSTQIMATIQIPVIDVDLAIYHGTSDEVLNRGMGILNSQVYL